MIRFSCPKCNKITERPKAGEKISCGKCGQRVRVPALPPNKTVLGTLLPDCNGGHSPEVNHLGARTKRTLKRQWWTPYFWVGGSGIALSAGILLCAALVMLFHAYQRRDLPVDSNRTNGNRADISIESLADLRQGQQAKVQTAAPKADAKNSRKVAPASLTETLAKQHQQLVQQHTQALKMLNQQRELNLNLLQQLQQLEKDVRSMQKRN